MIQVHFTDLVITSGIASKLQNLGSKIFENSSKIY